MNEVLRLRSPITVLPRDVEKAWLEQAKQVAAVSQVYDRLRSASDRAAAQLNEVLRIDVFEWFARGWRTVAAVRDALQLSATPRPPEIVALGRHTFGSTLRLALSAHMADRLVPELWLTLQLAASVASATLAIKSGRIELLALGDTSVTGKLKYDEVLLSEHLTRVEGAPRDPFKHRQVVSDSRARVDAHI
jgi:hypothetical protein